MTWHEPSRKAKFAWGIFWFVLGLGCFRLCQEFYSIPEADSVPTGVRVFLFCFPATLFLWIGIILIARAARNR